MPRLPCVTVVVPSYQRAAYLAPTIDSILAQDYPCIECIVVDGGSTDGTLDILRAYGDRVRWVSEPDQGHADAINKGWRMAHGDILAWLNADDLYPSQSIVSRVAAHFSAYADVDLVYGDCVIIDADGHPTGRVMHPPAFDLARAVLECEFVIPQPAAFLRRSLLDVAGWLDTDLVQKKDHEFWLRAALHGRIERLPTILGAARDIPGISQRGDQVGNACLQLTEKFLGLPSLPAEFRTPRFRRRARSSAHATAAAYAWPSVNGGHRARALRHVARAVALDPTNLPFVAYRFLGTLAAFHLPGLVRGVRRVAPPGRGGLRPAGAGGSQEAGP